jgi:hypothetical protein
MVADPRLPSARLSHDHHPTHAASEATGLQERPGHWAAAGPLTGPAIAGEPAQSCSIRRRSVGGERNVRGWGPVRGLRDSVEELVEFPGTHEHVATAQTLPYTLDESCEQNR